MKVSIINCADGGPLFRRVLRDWSVQIYCWNFGTVAWRDGDLN
jgi:hypothetical protein